jgi:hypothetical protein
MPSMPWTTAEKTVSTGKTRLEAGLRPPALPLRSEGLPPQAVQPPTTHHAARGCRRGAPQRPQPQRRAVLPGPRHAQRPDRRCPTQAGLAAERVAPPPGLPVLQHPCAWPTSALAREPGGGRPRVRVQRGETPPPARHRAGGRRARASGLVGWAVGPAPRPLGGRGSELGGDPPHGLPLAGPAPPAAPLPRGGTALPAPAPPRTGLAGRGVQGQGGGGAPPPAGRLWAHGSGPTAASPSAAVRPAHRGGLPLIPPPGCPAPALRHAALGPPASPQGIGPRPPPGIPAPPGLAAGTRGHQPATARGARTRPCRRRGSRHPLVQEPAPPVVPDAQALTPGGLCEVREPAQDGPGAPAPWGPQPHALGQDASHESVRRRQASYPRPGLAGVGLLGEGGRQPRHALPRPGIPDQG